MKKTRKSWLKELDALLTELVRKRDSRCVRCGKPDIAAAHIYPKGRYTKMRYEPDNVLGLCWNCHLNFGHRNPIEFTEWFKERYPDRYLYLKRRSQINDNSRWDYEGVKLYLKNQIKKL